MLWIFYGIGSILGPPLYGQLADRAGARIVPMVLAWIRELHPGDQERQNHIWSRATIDFAAFQALAAYAYSAVFAFSGGNYRLIFLLGAGSLASAVLLDLIGNPRRAI